MRNQYDRIGKQYLEGQSVFFKDKKDESFEFIKTTVASLDFKNKKILDVGCGDGRYMQALEKFGARNVYGLEESKIMFNEAKRAGLDSRRLFLGSIERTNFPSGAFDIIYSRFALQHLKRLGPMYKEVSRILSKGGIFIFAVPHPMRDIMLVKSREYKGGQSFKVRLFKNKVLITANMHLLREYISPVFLRFFSLETLAESRKSSIKLRGFKVPEFLGIAATKL